MIPEDLQALVLGDAVGALNSDERVELAARLVDLSPDQRSEVASLYETATVLAMSAEPVDPPPVVRERMLAAARTPTRYTVWSKDAEWFETGVPGIRARVLAVDKLRSLTTLVVRAEPGAVYPSHQHHRPEECFVLKGSLIIDGRVLHAGDYHHADEDSDHGEISTTEGAEVLIVGAIEDYLPAFLKPSDNPAN